MIKQPKPNSRNLTCTPLKIVCAVFLEHLSTRTESKQAWSKGMLLALWKFMKFVHIFSNSNDASTPSYPTTASWRAACPNLQHETGRWRKVCQKGINHAEWDSFLGLWWRYAFIADYLWQSIRPFVRACLCSLLMDLYPVPHRWSIGIRTYQNDPKRLLTLHDRDCKATCANFSTWWIMMARFFPNWHGG